MTTASYCEPPLHFEIKKTARLTTTDHYYYYYAMSANVSLPSTLISNTAILQGEHVSRIQLFHSYLELKLTGSYSYETFTDRPIYAAYIRDY